MDFFCPIIENVPRILNSRITGTHLHTWLLSYSLGKSWDVVSHGPPEEDALALFCCLLLSFLPAPNHILHLPHLFFPWFFFSGLFLRFKFHNIRALYSRSL